MNIYNDVCIHGCSVLYRVVLPALSRTGFIAWSVFGLSIAFTKPGSQNFFCSASAGVAIEPLPRESRLGYSDPCLQIRVHIIYHTLVGSHFVKCLEATP